MELSDPAPEDAWTPQQFWECPKCGRHFWTTYPPPKPAKPAAAVKPAAATKPSPAVKPAVKAKPAPEAKIDAPKAVVTPVPAPPTKPPATPK